MNCIGMMADGFQCALKEIVQSSFVMPNKFYILKKPYTLPRLMGNKNICLKIIIDSDIYTLIYYGPFCRYMN